MGHNPVLADLSELNTRISSFFDIGPCLPLPLPAQGCAPKTLKKGRTLVENWPSFWLGKSENGRTSPFHAKNILAEKHHPNFLYESDNKQWHFRQRTVTHCTYIVHLVSLIHCTPCVSMQVQTKWNKNLTSAALIIKREHKVMSRKI